jgi:hypothetical protein
VGEPNDPDSADGAGTGIDKACDGADALQVFLAVDTVTHLSRHFNLGEEPLDINDAVFGIPGEPDIFEVSFDFLVGGSGEKDLPENRGGDRKFRADGRRNLKWFSGLYNIENLHVVLLADSQEYRLIDKGNKPLQVRSCHRSEVGALEYLLGQGEQPLADAVFLRDAILKQEFSASRAFRIPKVVLLLIERDFEMSVTPRGPSLTAISLTTSKAFLRRGALYIIHSDEHNIEEHRLSQGALALYCTQAP